MCQYKGELVDMKEARKRESMYKKNEDIGCFMYYFPHKGEMVWYVKEPTNCSQVYHCYCIIALMLPKMMGRRGGSSTTAEEGIYAQKCLWWMMFPTSFL